jgi:PAS domain S-box-containing protein
VKEDVASRANADAHLTPSEARFRAVFEDAAIGIALVDLKGRPVECNPALERILGYTEEELRGMTFAEFTHPEDVQADLELYCSLVAGECNHYQIEKRYIRKDSQIVWARLTISLVNQEAGDRQLVVGMVEDITAQKLAQEALRDSDEKFSKAFEGNPSPTLITRRADGKVLEANRAFLEWFGVSAREARGRTAFDFGLWKSREEREEFLRMVYREGTLRNYEKMITLPLGEKRVTLLTVQPLWIKNEECLLAISNDITYQKQAEMALRASEESLRDTVENTPNVAIQWYDAGGRVIFWNHASETVFGWKASEAEGKTLAQLIFDDQESTRFMKSLEEVARTGDPVPPTEYSFRRRDGSHGVCLSTVFRISRGNDESCFVCMDVDVSERKQVERSLREAQERELRSRQEFTRELLDAEEQERQRLAAELHDSLGQNLSIIKNHAFLALAQPGLATSVTEHLNSISQFAAETIADVRDLARNLRPMQIEQLGLTDSIRELLERIQQSSSVRFERRIENVDEVIQGGSATHLYRILQEALNNLIKHSGANQAEFRLERDIHCVRLHLSDNGAGFDVERSSHRNGLGLRNIAERAQMLGGSLKIESSPGTGTRLVVEVPIHDEPGPEP